jgi:hypothetical protein
LVYFKRFLAVFAPRCCTRSTDRRRVAPRSHNGKPDRAGIEERRTIDLGDRRQAPRARRRPVPTPCGPPHRALTRFTGLCVFGAETALRHPAYVDPGAARRELAADHLVTGRTSLGPDRFEVDVLLVEAASGRAVWAETLERQLKPTKIIALRNEVANRVARALAQPYERDPV